MALKAEIISVGTELLMGQIVDTNAVYLASKLPDFGIVSHYRMTVGDNQKRLIDTIRLALSRSDIVFTIGGLGPTQDDLTKETVAAVLGDEMRFDPFVAQDIAAYFEKIGAQMADNNLKQAMVPKRGRVFKNLVGTAPGAAFETDKKTVIVLPGPPREFIPMVDNFVIPYIRNNVDCWGVIKSRILKITGMGEALVEEKIEALLSNDNPTIAPYAKFGEVHLRITASAVCDSEADIILDAKCDEICAIFGDDLFADCDETLEEVVVRHLLKARKTLAVAESCTGGMISSAITNVSGSSDVFVGGIVAYSNDVKINSLDVPIEIIENYGAVSEQCAEKMAQGMQRLTGADISVATTGIAGPGGGTDDKPVGLVYIAISSDKGTEVRRCAFAGKRCDVRMRAVQTALDMIRRILL